MIDAVHVGNADFCSPISHYFQFISVQGDTFLFMECPDACCSVFQMFSNVAFKTASVPF